MSDLAGGQGAADQYRGSDGPDGPGPRPGTASSQRWTATSGWGSQFVVAALSLTVGIVLLAATHDSFQRGSNARAAFLLGVLLTVIGVAGVLVTGRQRIDIDPTTRRITVTDTTLLRRATRVIEFADITDVRISYLGKRSNLLSFYSLRLLLSDGSDYPLFAPGRFYAGASDRATVYAWRTRLVALLD